MSATPAPTAPQAGGTDEEKPKFDLGKAIRRVVQGDLSSVRVILGLVVIAIIFQVQESRFLSAENLTNLMLQITTIGLISVGIVYVLLLGEIDLSVGAVSGLAGAVMVVLNVKHGWNPYLSIAAAVAVGAAIGCAQGFLFSKFVVPSFVVTLAGLLTWQGALLQVLGKTGSLNVTDSKITGLANIFYSNTTGWIIAVVCIVAYGLVLAIGYRRRVAAGLGDKNPAPQIVRFVVMAVITIGAVAILNSDRGVPLAVLILLGFVIGMEFVVQKTTFGRHVFAVGGSDEAARRAGIRVNGVRVAVFSISGHGPTEHSPVVEVLAEAGIPVLFVDFRVHPIEGTQKSIDALGEALGREKEAAAFIDFYDAHLKRITDAVAKLPDNAKPKVFLELLAGAWPAPGHTTGNGGFGDFINVVGGRNIAAGVVPGALGDISVEYALKADPDIYVVSGNRDPGVLLGAQIKPEQAAFSLARVLDRPAFKSLRAIRDGRAHGIWHEFYNSPYNILAIEALAKWVHPELFRDLDPKQTEHQLYASFLPFKDSGTYWVDEAARSQ